MNKQELVSAIADKANVSKKVAESMLGAFTSSVQDELEAGRKVQLVGFGTFEVRDRAARTGRNPQKPEEEIQIPAKTVAYFSPGKGLAEAVNKK